ncbi:MAG: Holliday junction branch migration DNA helicase RuvB [Lachnospiraceae bacterium]|nr:Holliday junction branch migration DNA helicase RuvB [Lachnospiraceae bacterium]
MARRIITTEKIKEDVKIETSLRPQYLKDYIGQEKLKSTLSVYIEAAKKRGEPLDHVLLFGPPGLGKTTLANIIANEMGVDIKTTSGPAIEKPGDIVAIIKGLREGDILFIDEIHRLNRQVEEILYSAMEDFFIDVVIGTGGANAKSMHIKLPHFTLIGATTRAGMLTAPLRDRFGVVSRMEFYTNEELRTIVENSAARLGVMIDAEGADELARRSRGTPRLANRFLKRVRDFAQVTGDGEIDGKIAGYALDLLEVDRIGLDHIDRAILTTMIEKFGGGPVGTSAVATTIGEDQGTVEDVYEPYLVQIGFILRTPRGRVIAKAAYEHLGIPFSE